MNYKIANVKVSIKTTLLFLDIVFKKCSDNNVYCKNYKNFLVLKDIYTFIIFKNNKNNENHINITKIPSLDLVQHAISTITQLTDCTVISHTIDNIIASTFVKSHIDLQALSTLFPNVKYNNEKFPGLFIKFKKGTAILFHSGKIVIVGSKTEEDIQCLIQNICARISIN